MGKEKAKPKVTTKSKPKKVNLRVNAPNIFFRVKVNQKGKPRKKGF